VGGFGKITAGGRTQTECHREENIRPKVEVEGPEDTRTRNISGGEGPANETTPVENGLHEITTLGRSPVANVEAE